EPGYRPANNRVRNTSRGVGNHLYGTIRTFAVAARIARGCHGVGCSTMEGEARVDFPALRQALRPFESGNMVVEIASQGISDIEVRVAILSLFVQRILRDVRQQTGLVVQGMTPGIRQLRGQIMP